jgi:hypothetical protein
MLAKRWPVELPSVFQILSELADGAHQNARAVQGLQPFQMPINRRGFLAGVGENGVVNLRREITAQNIR